MTGEHVLLYETHCVLEYAYMHEYRLIIQNGSHITTHGSDSQEVPFIPYFYCGGTHQLATALCQVAGYHSSPCYSKDYYGSLLQ